MTLQIKTTHRDATSSAITDETDWEPVAATTRRELFAGLQKDHGTARMLYRDQPRPDAAHSPSPAAPIGDRRETDPVPAGWVFSRNEAYTDDPAKTWKHEVWVEVRETEPEASTDFEAG